MAPESQRYTQVSGGRVLGPLRATRSLSVLLFTHTKPQRVPAAHIVAQTQTSVTKGQELSHKDGAPETQQCHARTHTGNLYLHTELIGSEINYRHLQRQRVIAANRAPNTHAHTLQSHNWTHSQLTVTFGVSDKLHTHTHMQSQEGSQLTAH